MKDEINGVGPDSQKEMLDAVRFIRQRLGRLIVAMYLLTLISIMTVSVVWGNLVTYYNMYVMLWGGATLGAAILGFFLGWLVGRRT